MRARPSQWSDPSSVVVVVPGSASESSPPNQLTHRRPRGRPEASYAESTAVESRSSSQVRFASGRQESGDALAAFHSPQTSGLVGGRALHNDSSIVLASPRSVGSHIHSRHESLSSSILLSAPLSASDVSRRSHHIAFESPSPSVAVDFNAISSVDDSPLVNNDGAVSAGSTHQYHPSIGTGPTPHIETPQTNVAPPNHNYPPYYTPAVTAPYTGESSSNTRLYDSMASAAGLIIATPFQPSKGLPGTAPIEPHWPPLWEVFHLKAFREDKFKTIVIGRRWDDEMLLRELLSAYNELRTWKERWFSAMTIGCVTSDLFFSSSDLSDSTPQVSRKGLRMFSLPVVLPSPLTS